MSLFIGTIVHLPASTHTHTHTRTLIQSIKASCDHTAACETNLQLSTVARCSTRVQEKWGVCGELLPWEFSSPLPAWYW